MLNSPKSIGMHFGTFPLADDGQYDPVNDLEIALEQQGVQESEFIVPKEGIKITLN
jgi:hypothetical protein